MISQEKIGQKRYLQWLEEILQEGKEAHVRVNGMSMFPWLLPKDVICVRKVEPDQLTLGRIVIFQGATGWVAHRLIRIESKNNQFICRGDANLQKDPPLTYSEIKGVVVGVSTQRVFWSNWIVRNMGFFFSQTSFLTAPLFWWMGRVVTLFWRWVVKSPK